ncbi:MAG TPA: adenine phosphoribosyltransferase, partial [Balneolaceae bacterium]|nr:adenine phosphoribosyltransferase [Balneolaceae bacterium]
SQLIVEPFTDFNIDYVVGIEARGFIFGAALARELDAGFIPIRKPGKLPVETISASYELEYGTGRLEMNKDALEPADRVIIHDDLIATGGSAKTAGELVKKEKGIVAGYSFIIELAALEGPKKLDNKAAKESLIRF